MAPSENRALHYGEPGPPSEHFRGPITRTSAGPNLPRMPDASNRPSAHAVQRAAHFCLENKARDVVILDLAGVSDMTDYFVIASGTSDTHVRSTGEHVLEAMRKDGTRAHHVEGLSQGRWVLLDFVDFVVHIFHPSLREFYQLERLWGDAAVVSVDQSGALR